jgi:hypothetical protein
MRRELVGEKAADAVAELVVFVAVDATSGSLEHRPHPDQYFQAILAP